MHFDSPSSDLRSGRAVRLCVLHDFAWPNRKWRFIPCPVPPPLVLWRQTVLVRASTRSLTDPRLPMLFFTFLAGPCMDMSPSILRGWKTPTSRNVFVGLTKK